MWLALRRMLSVSVATLGILSNLEKRFTICCSCATRHCRTWLATDDKSAFAGVEMSSANSRQDKVFEWDWYMPGASACGSKHPAYNRPDICREQTGSVWYPGKR